MLAISYCSTKTVLNCSGINEVLKWYFYFSCVFVTLEKGEGFGGKYVVSPLFWLPAIFTDWTLSAKHGHFSWSALMPPSFKTVWSWSLEESTEICHRQSCSMYVYYLKVFVWYFYGICMVLTEYLYPGCCVTGCASVWYWQSVFVFVFVFECICICICLCLCISRAHQFGIDRVFVYYLWGICVIFLTYLYDIDRVFVFPGCCVTECASVWYWQSGRHHWHPCPAIEYSPNPPTLCTPAFYQHQHHHCQYHLHHHHLPYGFHHQLLLSAIKSILTAGSFHLEAQVNSYIYYDLDNTK